MSISTRFNLAILTPQYNINIGYTPGSNFIDLINEAEFNYVLTREDQAKALADSKK